MKRLRRYIMLVLAGLFILISGCDNSGKDSDTDSNKGNITIAVIPKGTIHEFWKSVHAGAQKASRELGVEIIWKGSIREDDREEQFQIVESFIAQNVSAIVLAPLDDRTNRLSRYHCETDRGLCV